MNGDPIVIQLILGLTIAVGVLAMVFAAIATIKHFLHVCEPNEVLIFSGREHVGSNGQKSGWRFITEGRRSFRFPLLERVDRMDMSLISVPMGIRGAYSEGGIPLSVDAIANIKISSHPEVIGNAIERFLGKSRQEIASVAKETLEGHLRGVLATMTPEEVNEDRLKFADKLAEEAGADLSKLGLQLDVLKIQAVADDRQYLDSIGRQRIAEIVRIAEVAESDAIRTAEEAEATARSRAGVAKTRAQAAVQQKQNSLRQIEAQLEALAKSEEERSVQAAHQARAEAERDLQSIRAGLEQLRLAADVTIPADTNRRVRELVAEGQAAAIAARGEAIAASLAAVDAAWKECGDDAMDMLVAQHLDEIFSKVTEAATAIHARKVSLLDPGDGSTVASYVDSYPATVEALLRRISCTFGVDVAGVLRGERKRSESEVASADRSAA